MAKKYRVTWTKGDGIKYTESFASDVLSIEQVPNQFIQRQRSLAKTETKVLSVEELE